MRVLNLPNGFCFTPETWRKEIEKLVKERDSNFCSILVSPDLKYVLYCFSPTESDAYVALYDGRAEFDKPVRYVHIFKVEPGKNKQVIKAIVE